MKLYNVWPALIKWYVFRLWKEIERLGGNPPKKILFKGLDLFTICMKILSRFYKIR